MPVFMTHPEHGATHVNSGEVTEHEKNGWKVSTYEAWIGNKAKKAEEAPAVEAEEAPRRGRPRKV